MNKLIYALAGSAMMLAAPAFASVTVVASQCPSVLASDGGCLFEGNDSDLTAIETAYNTFASTFDPVLGGAPIDLVFVSKFDLPNTWTGVVGTVTGTVLNSDGEWIGGEWTLPVSINYVSVKAADGFTLFKYDPAVGSGFWDTVRNSFLQRNGKPPELSHLSFFSAGPSDPSFDPGGIPEPSSWAMLIAGFGLVGAVARRRKASGLTVAA